MLWADDSFISTWGDSSVFVLLANGKDTEPKAGRKKRWFALTLLVLMIVGATIGELPVTKEMFPDIKLDMFFFVSITTIVMAWTNLFPARKYTKYISWDILITIACAFAISKAMVNSGVADRIRQICTFFVNAASKKEAFEIIKRHRNFSKVMDLDICEDDIEEVDLEKLYEEE